MIVRNTDVLTDRQRQNKYLNGLSKTKYDPNRRVGFCEKPLFCDFLFLSKSFKKIFFRILEMLFFFYSCHVHIEKIHSKSVLRIINRHSFVWLDLIHVGTVQFLLAQSVGGAQDHCAPPGEIPGTNEKNL